MKTKTTPRALAGALLAAALLAPAAHAKAPAAPEPVREFYLLDPELPVTLPEKYRRAFLHEAKESLQGSRWTSQVIANTLTETLVFESTPADRARVETFVGTLKTKFLARHAAAAASPREGAEIALRLQVVIASRGGTNDAALPPALTRHLAETFGFDAFRNVGVAAAAGLEGTSSRMTTQVPWDGGAVVLLTAHLTPEWQRDGDFLSIDASFELKERRPGGKDPHGAIEAAVQTSYRPRASVPTVVGATPLGNGRSLLLLVSHEGPALGG